MLPWDCAHHCVIKEAVDDSVRSQRLLPRKGRSSTHPLAMWSRDQMIVTTSLDAGTEAARGHCHLYF